MSVLLTRTIETIVMPPMGPLLLIVLGALLLWMRRSSGWVLFGVGWVGLYLVSTPLASLLLAGWMESVDAVTPQQAKTSGAQAIVVISAGAYTSAPEYGGTTSGRYELERIRYAAYLQRETALPLAVIGADPYKDGEDSSVWIRSILENEFGVSVRWASTGSFNTREDARQARDLLRHDNIEHIVLVTHAGHVPRARWSFEQAGFRVLAAPTVFYTQRSKMAWWGKILPSAEALYRNRLYLHELVGSVWYRWFGG